ncbi:MAG: cytochrome b/b6 domain-containing protein [Chloroflexi bacterium]|nr:cytochrome b/b6 domain-containing protein [Chloroflexota bacterium]
MMAIAQLREVRHTLLYRVLHELRMMMIILLIITGFYIHRPFIADGGGFLMSLMRGVHYFAAGVLIVVVLLRIAGTFSGPYRDWPSFVPHGKDLKLLPKVLAYYLHLGPMPDITGKYNSIQMVTYVLLLLLVFFQIITGFVLQYPDGWLSWITYGVFNNEIEVRLAHYIFTWLFLIFLLFHTYLALRESSHIMKEIHLLPPFTESEEPSRLPFTKREESSEEIGEEKSLT